MKTISALEAKKRLAELRKKNPKSYRTNYFLNPLSENLLLLESENALILLNPDRHIHRLIFAYLDLADFEKLLCALPQNLQISLEIVSKAELDADLKAVLKRHMVYDTTFFRMSFKIKDSRNLDMKLSDDLGFANFEDIPAIEKMLCETFSYHSSHYPDENELEFLIKEKQVIVIKKETEITGLYIYKKIGRVVNSDQTINRDNDVKALLSMFSLLFSRIKKQDVDEIYGWIDIEKNGRVMNLNYFIGYRFDGLKNIIFVNDVLAAKLIIG